MSYDIRLGVKVEGLDLIAVIDEPEYSSPTYNIGNLFRECTGWDFRQGEWYRVSEVRPKIQRGIAELTDNPDKYKHLEPDNGWGTVDSALRTLESLEECIADNIGESSWGKWQELPPEHLWVRW